LNRTQTEKKIWFSETVSVVAKFLCTISIDLRYF